MMQVIEWIGFAVGLVAVVATAGSVLRTLVVPRGLAAKLSYVIARFVRKSFLAVANRLDDYESKDHVLARQAPIFLLVQLFTWLAIFYLGYALMLWPLVNGGLDQALLESGSSMLTLGFASTHTAGATVVHFMAAATGLVVVALQIGYLPTLYGAFNRRETLVTMLQSRAGAPAWGIEILLRHQLAGLLDRLGDLYADWERWAADVTESHTNYPVLLYFRSPHPLRSWVVGLLAVMDSAAVCLAVAPSLAPTEARLCLRMGFLCLRNIGDFMRIPYDPDPLPSDPISLTFEEFHAGIGLLEDRDFPMERTAEEAWPHFHGWRVNYESLAYAIADSVTAPPGPWSGPRQHLPGMEIIPQRPADRQPDDSKEHLRARGEGFGA
jgi:hypothetical protein